MGYLPTSKFGDCTQCPAKNVACVKVGKNLVCIPCHRNNKSTIQIQKANQRDHKRAELVKGMSPKNKRELKNRVKSKVRSLISRPDNLEGLGRVKEAEMKLYWMLAINELAKNPFCQECGAVIPNKKQNWTTGVMEETNVFYRAATAHVLPKRDNYGFPSVASNPNNRLFLGSGCGCHQRYDKSWEDAAQMKVFPIAIEKFKLLYPLIHSSERKNIPDIFLQEIEP